MLLLCANKIEKYIASGDIIINPKTKIIRDKTSIRLRLGREIKTTHTKTIQYFEDLKIGDEVIIKPQESYLIKSLEKITLSNRVQGFVSQTTNLALKGFQIIGGSGVEPEHDDTLSFILRNLHNEPQKIIVGDPIVKLYFFDIAETMVTKDGFSFYDWENERKKYE